MVLQKISLPLSFQVLEVLTTLKLPISGVTILSLKYLSSHFCRLLVLNKLYSTFHFSSIQSIFEWVEGILSTAVVNTRNGLDIEYLSRILGLAQSHLYIFFPADSPLLP